MCEAAAGTGEGPGCASWCCMRSRYVMELIGQPHAYAHARAPHPTELCDKAHSTRVLVVFGVEQTSGLWDRRVSSCRHVALHVGTATPAARGQRKAAMARAHRSPQRPATHACATPDSRNRKVATYATPAGGMNDAHAAAAATLTGDRQPCSQHHGCSHTARVKRCRRLVQGRRLVDN